MYIDKVTELIIKSAKASKLAIRLVFLYGLLYIHIASYILSTDLDVIISNNLKMFTGQKIGNFNLC